MDFSHSESIKLPYCQITLIILLEKFYLNEQKDLGSISAPRHWFFFAKRLERSDKREISQATAARFGRSEARMSDKVVEASHVAGHKL